MKKELWIRLGCSLCLSDDEIEKALSGDPELLREVITAAITEKRFRLDGESYIPGSWVEDFNDKYNTDFPAFDYETDI